MSRKTSKAAASSRAISACLWLFALGVLITPVLFAVLESDSRYRLEPRLTGTALQLLREEATWQALWRSSLIAMAAIAVGIGVVAALLSLLRRHRWVALLAVAFYSVDPTTRGIAYRALFEDIGSLAVLSPTADFLRLFLAPTVALGCQYAPLFWFLRLFGQEQTVQHRNLPSLAEFVFVRIPGSFPRLPVEGALFFLLGLFDLWLVQLVTGSTVNLWGPLLIQRTLRGRDLAAGGLMTIVGLVVVLAFFLGMGLTCRLMGRLWLKLRPLWFAGRVRLDRLLRSFESGAAYCGLLLIGWPLGYAFFRAIAGREGEASFFAPPEGAAWAIGVTIMLGLAGGFIGCNTGISMVLGRECRFVGPTQLVIPSVVLALAPEAAFLLLAAAGTVAGIVGPGAALAVTIILSFSIPIAYLCWSSYFSSPRLNRLELPIRLFGKRPLAGVRAASREFGPVGSGITALLFWLVSEDVVLLDFVGGPAWKPFAAVQYGLAQKGLVQAEYAWAVLATATRMVPLLALGLLSAPHIQSNCLAEKGGTKDGKVSK